DLDCTLHNLSLPEGDVAFGVHTRNLQLRFAAFLFHVGDQRDIVAAQHSFDIAFFQLISPVILGQNLRLGQLPQLVFGSAAIGVGAAGEGEQENEQKDSAQRSSGSQHQPALPL